MLRHRVIPALLLRKGGLVKTRRFKDPVYVGDPTNAIRIFNDKEVDELMVLDIEATRSGAGPDFGAIELFAGECFMPLAYGGGIQTLDQAARIFDLGVEKICLQTAALSDVSLVTRIAERYGSQSVIVSIDIKRDWRKRPWLYGSYSKKLLTLDWLGHANKMTQAGAGEILLNVVDRDGMMSGYDVELVRSLAGSVQVPIIALGGAGNLDHMREAVVAGASAVAAGSMFVFHGPHRAVLITYPRYQDMERMLDISK
ncbi:imidazole glycerol phosphate synthase subunit HisF [Pusillimonas sp. T2]|uniref:AglZ/HisF2 family acetamidino modification protein n=1 Tax=Pusillimonas sp. T2 TaxID=1548123 RepID=UPI000B94652E|nr:AglZ/HisF2 family acetamidino modification protein [Pusillimonas sp. T2]OXR48702.1 imidazole glycerol phosphate synthase subunit HisF [Pusillimonas sp. T2]